MSVTVYTEILKKAIVHKATIEWTQEDTTTYFNVRE